MKIVVIVVTCLLSLLLSRVAQAADTLETIRIVGEVIEVSNNGAVVDAGLNKHVFLRGNRDEAGGSFVVGQSIHTPASRSGNFEWKGQILEAYVVKTKRSKR